MQSQCAGGILPACVFGGGEAKLVDKLSGPIVRVGLRQGDRGDPGVVALLTVGATIAAPRQAGVIRF